jgi:hypothetical protein
MRKPVLFAYWGNTLPLPSTHQAKNKFRKKQAVNRNQYLYHQYFLGDRSKRTNSQLYSLRWQVEIVFKTWKSFFQMDRCKEVKRERLECHLYGQLIAILICSSTLFQMRELLLRNKQKELSEYKAFYMIQTYFPLFHQAIQQQNT